MFFILFFIIVFMFMGGNIIPQKSPEQFFGKKPGEDRVLIKYPDIVNYFKYLASESRRIRVTDEGTSTLGNPMILAAISSEENIRQLKDLSEINQKLANPDKLAPGEANELQKKGKVFVLITCSIHASEIAATQMSMIFAHKAATTKDSRWKEYLDNVVILLMPSINPDGNIMVTDWYNKYLKTEFEGGPTPFLYHHYAGHDNNRDFYMLNLKESRVVNAVLHNRYFPHIFLDMHQMGSTGPRMFVPPFNNPLNPNLEPLLMRETDIIGINMAWKLQEHGKQGVASSYGFDAYWPGGSKNTAWYKNVVGVLTEMASVSVASPIYVESNELNTQSKGLPEYKAQVNFPDPWPGGWWKLRDIIDYELIAAESLVEIASKNKDSFLTNFYKLGLSNIEKGKTLAPYAYIIPLEQWDTPTMYTFLSIMEENGVRIFKLDADTHIGNSYYSKGSFIIPMDQPYRSFIKVMMEKQTYPDIKHMVNGPIIEPYDACGWTLPLQMGVKAVGIDSPLDRVSMSAVNKITLPGGTISGEGDYYRIPARFNHSAIVVNRLQKKDITVFRYTGGKTSSVVEPGDFLVMAKDISTEEMKKCLTGTGVNIVKASVPGSVVKEIKKPLIGIYQSYRARIDEGWTRLILDKFEFSYTILFNKDFDEKNAELLSKYNVIIFPAQDRDSIVEGKSSFPGYDNVAAIPVEYKGGIGTKGLEMLKKFVNQGGTLVLLDTAAELGMKDFSLPLFNRLKDVKPEDFYCPGSILKIAVDNTDPIGWGMEKDSILYMTDNIAFKTRIPPTSTMTRKVVAGFNETGPHLLSGYLKGESMLDRLAMIVRFDYLKGRIIILGGRTQNRAQTHASFKFLFNSIYSNGL